MAYFLKKAKLKGRTYLSIVESYYSHDKRGSAHRTYKSLSSVETWKAKGIDDPVAHFQKEVDKLNEEGVTIVMITHDRRLSRYPIEHLK